MAESLTQKWLRQNTQSYAQKDIVYAHADAVLRRYQAIRPKTDIYTYDDGRTQLLLCLHGLLPITYRGSPYNIPIAVWLSKDYPRQPPIAYVVPTTDMLVRPSKYIDVSGKCGIEYLRNWERKSEGCNLLALLEAMQDHFSREPPVYAKPKPSPTPQPQQSRTPASGADYSARPPPPVPPVHPASPPLSQAASSGNDDRPPLPLKPPSTAVSSPSVAPSAPAPSTHPSMTGPPPARPPPVPPHPPDQALPRYKSPSVPPQYYQRPHASIDDASNLPAATTWSPDSPAFPPHRVASLPIVSSEHPASAAAYTRPPPPLPPAAQPPPVIVSQTVPPPLPPHPPAQPVPRPPPPATIPAPFTPPHTQSPYASPPPPHTQISPPPIVQAHSSNPPPDLLDADDLSSMPVTSAQSTSPAPAPPRPPNPELLRLHGQVHAKLTSELASLEQVMALDAERLRALQNDLLAGEPAIRDEMARLEAVRDVCQGVAARLRAVVSDGERNVAELKRKGDPDVDELVCSTTIVHNQLINLVAEDNAIEDTMYHLHRALNSGRIDLERFLRTTRVLAEEQFMKRALIEKILNGLPMGETMDWR